MLNDLNSKLAEWIATAALTGCEKEYSKKTVKDRSSRVQARRNMIKSRGAAAVRGKDIEHKDGNPLNNSPSNLTLRDRSANRSDNGHRKGETYAKAKKGITNTFKKRSDTRTSRAILGAGAGGLAGLGLGGLGGAIYESFFGDKKNPQVLRAALRGAALGGVAGLGIGGALGASKGARNLDNLLRSSVNAYWANAKSKYDQSMEEELAKTDLPFGVELKRKPRTQDELNKTLVNSSTTDTKRPEFIKDEEDFTDISLGKWIDWS